MTRISRIRAAWIGLAALAVGLGAASPGRAQGQKDTLRVGISIAELPTTTGQPTQGGTGFRWAGWTIFELADLLGHNAGPEDPDRDPLSR